VNRPFLRFKRQRKPALMDGGLDPRELQRRSVEARRRKAAGLAESQARDIPHELDSFPGSDPHGHAKAQTLVSRSRSGGGRGRVSDSSLIPRYHRVSSENFANSKEPSRASIFQERRPTTEPTEPTRYPYIDSQGLLVTMPPHLRDRHVVAVEPVSGVNGPPDDSPAPRTRILGGSWDGHE